MGTGGRFRASPCSHEQNEEAAGDLKTSAAREAVVAAEAGPEEEKAEATEQEEETTEQAKKRPGGSKTRPWPGPPRSSAHTSTETDPTEAERRAHTALHPKQLHPNKNVARMIYIDSDTPQPTSKSCAKRFNHTCRITPCGDLQTDVQVRLGPTCSYLPCSCTSCTSASSAACGCKSTLSE